MRNVPVICSVPSSVTPWSINPVHSSLLPPFELPGHFHAILGILVSHCSESVEQVKEPCAKNPPHVSNPRLIERTVELAQASTGQFSCPFTSSGDRRALPIGYRRKIQVRADRGEPWYARAGKSWCRGGAAALRAPREYWDRDASHLFPCCRVHGAARREAFDLANRQSAAGCALRVAHAQLGIENCKQGAAVAGAKLPFFDPVLDGWLKLQ